jgi:hypothetical protein
VNALAWAARARRKLNRATDAAAQEMRLAIVLFEQAKEPGLARALEAEFKKSPNRGRWIIWTIVLTAIVVGVAVVIWWTS